MSSIEPYKQAKDVVLLCEADFVSMADKQTWAKESRFALNLLKDNPYLAQQARSNLDSLRSAIISVAATGLTLNPIKRHAYLVPRKIKINKEWVQKICLDIGYLGYVAMATESDNISYVKAEIVRQKDIFEIRLDAMPEHRINVFEDRGDIVGAYCLAKLADGSVMTEWMGIAEIYAIRDRSQSYKAFLEKKASTPWETDKEEMIKKTVVKRASKYWPVKANQKKRLDAAMEIELEELDETPVVDVSQGDDKRTTLMAEIRENIFVMDRQEEQTVEYCAKIYQRKIASLDELTTYEAQKLNAMLLQHIAKLDEQTVNQKRKDYRNENNGADSELTLDLPAELQLETD